MLLERDEDRACQVRDSEASMFECEVVEGARRARENTVLGEAEALSPYHSERPCRVAQCSPGAY